MGRYVTVSVYTDVDVDLEKIDTDDLIDELESRGEFVNETLPSSDLKQLVESLWIKRRQKQSFDRELDDLIYGVLGRII